MHPTKPSIAVITTTINVPEVLTLYARLAPEAAMFVTGDQKTPHDAVRALLRPYENVRYYDVDDQIALGYRCADVMGWNTIQRRNIALLEAMRSGADVILTIDDDNIPADRNYFTALEDLFGRPFDGLLADSATGWIDIGALLTPRVHHRGFPYDRRSEEHGLKMAPVVGARIGVAAGLWLGDPDIDAMARITNGPTVHHLSEVLRGGVAVKPGCKTPFNSQNTAFRREIAAALPVWFGVGRYDDIWASYAALRLMREMGLHLHFGPPLVWQERNTQNLFKNLEDEMLGMKNTPRLVADLDAMDLAGGTVVERMRSMFTQLADKPYMPAPATRLGLAWCEDAERVLER